MKAIVIGASKESIFAIEKCKDMGIEIYAIDGNEDALGLKHANHSKVIDIRDTSEVIDYVKTNGIEFVVPVAIGRFLTVIGQVNDYFGFKGISYNAALNCVDKWLFHQKLSAVNLRNNECYLYNENSEILNTKYPVIAKPRFGSGSKGVIQLNNHNELSEFLVDNHEDYLVEEMFVGIEYGIDAQIIDGKLSIILIREKANTPPPHMQAVGYYSAFETKYKSNFETDVYNLINNAVNTLELNDCLIHVDLLVSEKELFIVEMSGRPSGHNLHNNFTIKATNYDMIDNFLKYQTTGVSNVNLVKNNVCIHYFDLTPGKVIKVPTEEELERFNLLEYVCNINVGDNLEIVSNGPILMDRGYFIIAGENRVTIDEQIEALKKMFIIEEAKHV